MKRYEDKENSMVFRIGKLDKKKSFHGTIGHNIALIETLHLNMTIKDFLLKICKDRRIKNAEMHIQGIKYFLVSQD